MISNLTQQVASAGALHLFLLTIALTAALWLSNSLWQPKLNQLAESKFFLRKNWFFFLFIGLAASLLFVFYTAIYDLPVPRVHDENCYLLMAKTFAEGRITNPPHSLWQFFEHFHLINQPTYTAKYPPAQAAFLAIGILLFNHPIFGVWLSGALAAGACFWMLRAFFSTNWSLYGALLSLTHPTIFGWSQNYWGGNAAMLGGTLCIGALFRFVRTTKTKDAVIFAFGIAILANSRPFEGLLVCLPLAAVIVYSIIKRFRRAGLLRQLLYKFVVPVSLVLLLNFVWMGYYNWRVTGDALKLPYSLYTQQYDPVPLLLIFSTPNENINYHHSVMKAFYEGEVENQHLVLYTKMRKTTLLVLALRRSLHNTIDFLHGTFFLYVGILLLGIYVFRANKKYLFFIAAFFFCLLLEGVATYNQNHYYAPFVPFLIIAATAALTRAFRKSKNSSGKKLVVSFSLALIFVQVVWLFISPRIINAMLSDDSNLQYVFQRNFNNLSGKHLVLVDYSNTELKTNGKRYNPLTLMSWVYNEPDIDQSKIVWANNMGGENNRRLFEYFNDRQVWVLGFEKSNKAKLLSCEGLPSQHQPGPELEAALKIRCPNGK